MGPIISVLSVLLLIAGCALSASIPSAPLANICSGPHVQLLVSPVVEDGLLRRITYEWQDLPNGAEIGIFSSDPTSGSANLIFSSVPNTASSWGNTTIEETHIPYDKLGFEGKCLGPYIAYKTDNDWTGVSCLRTEPTWMTDLKDTIGSKSLKQLFIPGTHDSSAYKEANLDKPDEIIMKYSVTQDEPVLGQLIYGARYLDLRPAYYPNNEHKWWGNHGIIQFHPMSEILGNLTEFLKNTNEIIILDVHEFPYGFGDGTNIHLLFIEYLRETLREYIIPTDFNWDSTLDELWASGGRLIIGYNDGRFVGNDNDILWPAVRQMWGDKQHRDDLMEYLQETVSHPPDIIWSAMAQLTSTAGDILLDSMKGLRHAAEEVNHDVTVSFRSVDWAKNANIVAMDFLRGSGIVRAAIEWNKATSCTE